MFNDKKISEIEDQIKTLTNRVETVLRTVNVFREESWIINNPYKFNVGDILKRNYDKKNSAKHTTEDLLFLLNETGTFIVTGRSVYFHPFGVFLKRYDLFGRETLKQYKDISERVLTEFASKQKSEDNVSSS